MGYRSPASIFACGAKIATPMARTRVYGLGVEMSSRPLLLLLPPHGLAQRPATSSIRLGCFYSPAARRLTARILPSVWVVGDSWAKFPRVRESDATQPAKSVIRMSCGSVGWRSAAPQSKRCSMSLKKIKIKKEVGRCEEDNKWGGNGR